MGLKFEVNLDAVGNDWGESIEVIVKDELRKCLKGIIQEAIKERKASIDRLIEKQVSKWLNDPAHQEEIDKFARSLYPAGMKSPVFK